MGPSLGQATTVGAVLGARRATHPRMKLAALALAVDVLHEARCATSPSGTLPRMRRRRPWGIAFTCVTIACSYRDVPGDRRVERSFTVTSVASAPLAVGLAPTDCATESVVLAEREGAGSSRRHPTDAACLAKLQVGATVTFERQRERQGCMPGVVYYPLLGGCALGALELVSKGSRCTGRGAP